MKPTSEPIVESLCQRKGSEVVWELTDFNNEYVFLINWSQFKPNSRCVKMETFKKNWICFDWSEYRKNGKKIKANKYVNPWIEVSQ